MHELVLVFIAHRLINWYSFCSFECVWLAWWLSSHGWLVIPFPLLLVTPHWPIVIASLLMDPRVSQSRPYQENLDTLARSTRASFFFAAPTNWRWVNRGTQFFRLTPPRSFRRAGRRRSLCSAVHRQTHTTSLSAPQHKKKLSASSKHEKPPMGLSTVTSSSTATRAAPACNVGKGRRRQQRAGVTYARARSGSSLRVAC